MFCYTLSGIYAVREKRCDVQMPSSTIITVWSSLRLKLSYIAYTYLIERQREEWNNWINQARSVNVFMFRSFYCPHYGAGRRKIHRHRFSFESIDFPLRGNPFFDLLLALHSAISLDKAIYMFSGLQFDDSLFCSLLFGMSN